MSDTTVNVARAPECDIHKYDQGVTGVPAVVDGKTTRGPWANMCAECFDAHGVGLGLGRGQRFIVAEPTPGPGAIPADHDAAMAAARRRIRRDGTAGVPPVAAPFTVATALVDGRTVVGRADARPTTGNAVTSASVYGTGVTETRNVKATREVTPSRPTASRVRSTHVGEEPPVRP